MTAATEARLPEDVMEREIRIGEDAGRIVERMSDELELWASELEAALFLAGLALARGRQPVHEAEAPREVSLGTLEQAGEPDELDALAILGIVEGTGDEPEPALAEALPGWIEAGAELVAERLETDDPVEASGAILALVQDAT